MPCDWITHKSIEILYADYRGLETPEQMIELLNEVIRMEEENAPARVLVDYTGVRRSPLAYFSKVVTAGHHRKKHVLKTALLGIRGVKTQLLNTYIRLSGDDRIQVFQTREEALDWLTETS